MYTIKSVTKRIPLSSPSHHCCCLTITHSQLLRRWNFQQQYPLFCERCFSSTRRRSSLLAAQTLPSRWRGPGHMTVVSVELGERQHGRHACGVSKQIATLVQLTPPRRAIENKNVVQKRKVGPSVPRTNGEGSMDGDNKLQFPTLPATKEELLVSVYVWGGSLGCPLC